MAFDWEQLDLTSDLLPLSGHRLAWNQIAKECARIHSKGTLALEATFLDDLPPDFELIADIANNVCMMLWHVAHHLIDRPPFHPIA